MAAPPVAVSAKPRPSEQAGYVTATGAASRCETFAVELKAFSEPTEFKIF